MLSPFPGMNPFLESLLLWREVHNRLMVALANDQTARYQSIYNPCYTRSTRKATLTCESIINNPSPNRLCLTAIAPGFSSASCGVAEREYEIEAV